MQWSGQAADRENIKRQAANGQCHKNSPGKKRANTLGGKYSAMSDGAKQDFAMREMKSKAYKACLTECSCVISANE